MMKTKRLLSCFVSLCIFTTTLAQTFTCDGRFIISLYGSNPPTNAYWIHLGAAPGDVSFNALATYNGIQFNASAYNRIDNYLYGTRLGSNQIVRIRADGSFQSVGNVPLVGQINTGAGDSTPGPGTVAIAGSRSIPAFIPGSRKFLISRDRKNC